MTDLELKTQERLEKQRIASRKWKESNKERISEYHREWIKLNPEKARAIYKRDVEKNKERRRAYAKAWREKNREKLIHEKKAWYLANRARIRSEHKSKYSQASALGLASGGLFLSQEMAEKRKNGCVFCGANGHLELDHILPKSRGGENCESNLQWLCRLCNFAKGDMTVGEFVIHIKKIMGHMNDRS